MSRARLESLLLPVWSVLVRLRRVFRTRTDVGIFLLLVFVATVLWYLTKLSHEYTVDIRHDVRLAGHPKGALLVGEPSRQVWLRLRGRGHTLLEFKTFSSGQPFKLDMEGDEYTRRSPERGVLSRTQMAALFGPQLPSGLVLESVLTDSIVCEFSPLDRRLLPVRAQLTYSLAPQHVAVRPMEVVPDSIWVQGPKAELEQLDSLLTVAVDLGELRSSFDSLVALEPLPADLDMEAREVSVRMPISEFTQKEMDVEVRAVGVPDSLGVDLLPRTVRVRCAVHLARYQRLGPKDLDLFCEFSPYAVDGRYIVQVGRLPEGVFGVEITPSVVGSIVTSRY
ncbi:MAG: hypothetical protein CSA07_00400 [Bacteroidia bacterium]|nr:MAG: hypothetical protein CSA07_00400 [Bacteroidia bacterium]